MQLTAAGRRVVFIYNGGASRKALEVWESEVRRYRDRERDALGDNQDNFIA